MLSGFTIVRNAVKLDFPIVPAIRSVLEVCDEVVVNVGKSEDETRDLVTSIGDPRVRIIDTESERLVQEAIERLMAHRTVFVIAHRLATVQHADFIVVLAEGRIVERGSHDDLLAADGLYRRLYNLQFRT